MEMTPYFIRLQSLHLFYQNCSEKLSNDICFLASCRIFTTVLVFWRKLLGKSKFKLKKNIFDQRIFAAKFLGKNVFISKSYNSIVIFEGKKHIRVGQKTLQFRIVYVTTGGPRYSQF